MTASVRRLTPDDYDALRALRLESLRLYPECFAADPDQEEAMPKEGSPTACNGKERMLLIELK